MAAEHKRTESYLISVTSILILSAFLIGMAIGNNLGTELEPYILACGLSGLLAFIGLELAAYGRRVQAIEDEKRHIECRLQRHVMSQSQAGFSLPESAAPAEEESVGAA